MNTPKKSCSRFRLILRIAFAVFALSALAAPPQGSFSLAAPASSPLEKQVREWAAELAREEPFARWKDAEFRIQALGPGTHSWLVIVKSGEETVGYMVVHAAEDGSYRLGEYGTGPNVLFSEETFRMSLAENGLVPAKDVPLAASRAYFHPFAAVWIVRVDGETHWIDAKTGEWLPLDAESWREMLPELRERSAESHPPKAAFVSGKRFLGETFDAYESLPWLAGERPYAIKSAKKVQRRIAGGLHLKYVTEPYGDLALYALPVTGYHAWREGRLDLALDMAGHRFVPLETLQRLGAFYE